MADTVCAPSRSSEALPAQPIDPPTIAITVSVNDSPLAGRDGDKVQSRVIRERLLREAEANVAIKVAETAEKDAFEVAGRGELQLGVLIEIDAPRRLRALHQPPARGLPDRPENGERLEPIEEVTIDVDDDYTGVVIEKLSARKAELVDMRPSGAGKTRITFDGAVALADRLPGRVPHRHPRLGRAEPRVRALRALQGRDRGPPQRRPDLQLRRRHRRPTPCGTSRTAASCSSAPARRPTRA